MKKNKHERHGIVESWNSVRAKRIKKLQLTGKYRIAGYTLYPLPTSSYCNSSVFTFVNFDRINRINSGES